MRYSNAIPIEPAGDQAFPWEEPLRRLCGCPVTALEPVGLRAEARIYRGRLQNGRPVAVKAYPEPGPADPLGVEYGALSFLAGTELASSVPAPIGANANLGLAVYAWVDGEPVEANDPAARKPEDVDAMLAFLDRLHAASRLPEARSQPAGAGSAFSGAELVSRLRRRRRNLGARHAIDLDVQAFLRHAVDPALDIMQREAAARLARLGLDFDAALPGSECTLSRIALGFDATLRRPDGALAFVDFQKFGWDDPVRVTADLLWNTRMRLDECERTQFAEGLGLIFGQLRTYIERFPVLFPLYGLAWSLHLLEAGGPARADAADGAAGGEATRAMLLTRAQRILDAALLSAEGVTGV